MGRIQKKFSQNCKNQNQKLSTSKSTLSLNNLKILRPKVTKNLTNFRKKFCEFPP